MESRGAFFWENPDQDFWSVALIIPFEQIHFQIRDLSKPLYTRIYRITDLRD